MSDIKDCEHEVFRHPVRLSPEDDDYESWKDKSQGSYGYWEYPQPDTTFEDLDTHRMKCSLCGKIEYYSEYGRSLYE